MAPASSAELTTISELMLFTVTGVEAESVTKMQYQVFATGETEPNVADAEDRPDKVCTREPPLLQVELAEE